MAYPYDHPQSTATNNNVTEHASTGLKPSNPFPPVNTIRLNSSAQRFQKLMKQANLLADKIVNSDEFAEELMDAAQLSNEKKVHELILSTGITLKLETKFTPTGILVDLDNSDEGHGCCNLLMTLHW